MLQVAFQIEKGNELERLLIIGKKMLKMVEVFAFQIKN